MASSIFIESREWFDRSGGNSYFSNRVWIDGRVAFQTGLRYGYGEHYIWDAMHELVLRGLMPAEAESNTISQIRIKTGIVIYTVQSRVAKRDLFRDWDREAILEEARSAS